MGCSNSSTAAAASNAKVSQAGVPQTYIRGPIVAGADKIAKHHSAKDNFAQSALHSAAYDGHDEVVPPAGAGPIDDHIAMLRKHIDENKEKFRRSQDKVARFNFSKMVEIDEKGTAVIDEGDLVEYCTSLASILDEEEPGLAMKLQQEICQQKTRMGSGTLQPLVKTSVVGVDNAGAFSVVQVFAKWDDNNEIQVTYSQMGRSWSVPQGQPSPTTEVMRDYYQYKAVGTMLEMLGAPASGSQPEVRR